MKIIILSALILIIVFTGSVAAANFLSVTCNDINSSLNTLEDSIKRSDWDSAQRELTNVDDKWENINNRWAMLLDHQEIDNIEIGLAKMNEFVKAKSTPDALAEISALKLLFEHIPEKESLKFRNIF